MNPSMHDSALWVVHRFLCCGASRARSCPGRGRLWHFFRAFSWRRHWRPLLPTVHTLALHCVSPAALCTPS